MIPNIFCHQSESSVFSQSNKPMATEGKRMQPVSAKGGKMLQTNPTCQ